MLKAIAPASRTINTLSNLRQHLPTSSRALATLSYDYADHTDNSNNSSTTTTASNPTSHQREHNAHTLLILGKPGGGKGTISGKILNDFPQFRHVSTGDQLRQHVRNETSLGREAKKYMDGEFFFPELMIDSVLFVAKLSISIISEPIITFFFYDNKTTHTHK